jgi:DNA-binding NtrC family response regulator
VTAPRLDPAPDRGLPDDGLRAELHRYERALILHALDRAHGNRARAARLLQLPLRTFWHRLRAHGITRDDRDVPNLAPSATRPTP